MDARKYTRIHNRGGLMSFSKDALLHKLQDEIDSLFRDNIVIPIAWCRDEDGKTIYDTEHMQNEFEDELEQLIIEEQNKK